MEAQLPVVITVTNDEHNQPRIPKVRDTIMAHRQPLTTWTLDDLATEPAETRAGNVYSEVTELFIPRKNMRCEFAGGQILLLLCEKLRALMK